MKNIKALLACSRIIFSAAGQIAITIWEKNSPLLIEPKVRDTRRPDSPVGRLADFALLQAAVAQVLRGAELPPVAPQAAREVDFVVEGGRGDGGGHGAQAVQSLQQGDGLEARGHRVGALPANTDETSTCEIYTQVKKKKEKLFLQDFLL